MATESSRLAAFSQAIRESSLGRFRSVPFAHVNWRPTPRALSIAELAQHLVDADRWLFDKLQNPGLAGMKAVAGTLTLSCADDYDGLLGLLVTTGLERSRLISSMTTADLEGSIPDDRFGGDVTTWWVVVRGNLDHEIHHRGQLATYLRILSDGAAF